LGRDKGIFWRTQIGTGVLWIVLRVLQLREVPKAVIKVRQVYSRQQVIAKTSSMMMMFPIAGLILDYQNF
jgi:hypothetical protein